MALDLIYAAREQREALFNSSPSPSPRPRIGASQTLLDLHAQHPERFLVTPLSYLDEVALSRRNSERDSLFRMLPDEVLKKILGHCLAFDASEKAQHKTATLQICHSWRRLEVPIYLANNITVTLSLTIDGSQSSHQSKWYATVLGGGTYEPHAYTTRLKMMIPRSSTRKAISQQDDSPLTTIFNNILAYPRVEKLYVCVGDDYMSKYAEGHSDAAWVTANKEKMVLPLRDIGMDRMQRLKIFGPSKDDAREEGKIFARKMLNWVSVVQSGRVQNEGLQDEVRHIKELLDGGEFPMPG